MIFPSDFPILIHSHLFLLHCMNLHPVLTFRLLHLVFSPHVFTFYTPRCRTFILIASVFFLPSPFVTVLLLLRASAVSFSALVSNNSVFFSFLSTILPPLLPLFLGGLGFITYIIVTFLCSLDIWSFLPLPRSSVLKFSSAFPL